jgi:hypothetical protein
MRKTITTTNVTLDGAIIRAEPAYEPHHDRL